MIHDGNDIDKFFHILFNVLFVFFCGGYNLSLDKLMLDFLFL